MLQKYQFILLLALIGALIFSSCEKKEKYDPPSLDEETMIEVLKTLFVTEVKTIDTYELSIQKDKFIKEYIYPELFDSLNIDDSLFYQSYHFYEEQPAKLAGLLEKVVAAIDSMSIDSITFVPSTGKSLDDAYKEIHELEEIRKNKKHLERRNDH